MTSQQRALQSSYGVTETGVTDAEAHVHCWCLDKTCWKESNFCKIIFVDFQVWYVTLYHIILKITSVFSEKNERSTLNYLTVGKCQPKVVLPHTLPRKRRRFGIMRKIGKQYNELLKEKDRKTKQPSTKGVCHWAPYPQGKALETVRVHCPQCPSCFNKDYYARVARFTLCRL